MEIISSIRYHENESRKKKDISYLVCIQLTHCKSVRYEVRHMSREDLLWWFVSNPDKMWNNIISFVWCMNRGDVSHEELQLQRFAEVRAAKLKITDNWRRKLVCNRWKDQTKSHVWTEEVGAENYVHCTKL